MAIDFVSCVLSSVIQILRSVLGFVESWKKYFHNFQPKHKHFQLNKARKADSFTQNIVLRCLGILTWPLFWIVQIFFLILWQRTIELPHSHFSNVIIIFMMQLRLLGYLLFLNVILIEYFYNLMMFFNSLEPYLSVLLDIF